MICPIHLPLLLQCSILEQAYKFSYDNMQLLKIDFNIIYRNRKKQHLQSKKERRKKQQYIK